jgi:hypothetical protein
MQFAAQLFEHAPQFAGSVARLASQPSEYVLLQSLNVLLHEPMAQTPWLHTGPPLATLHAFLQVPQFAVSVVTLTSQPSLGS